MPRRSMLSVLVSIATDYIIPNMRHCLGQPMAISLTGRSCPMRGKSSMAPKGSANCDSVRQSEITPRLATIRNFHSKVRKRAKYALIPRSLARARPHAKSAIDSRKVGGMTSLIEVMTDPVLPIRAARWCASQVPSCRNIVDVAPPGTKWGWRRKRPPRHPPTPPASIRPDLSVRAPPHPTDTVSRENDFPD